LSTGDYFVAQITSVFDVNSHSVVIGPDGFSEGGLPLVSLIRADNIFTAHPSLFIRTIGRVKDEKLRETISKVVKLLIGAPKTS